MRRAPSRAISSSSERPLIAAPPISSPATVSMDAAPFRPRALRRLSLRPDDTSAASRAPRSTTSGNTSKAAPSPSAIVSWPCPWFFTFAVFRATQTPGRSSRWWWFLRFTGRFYSIIGAGGDRFANDAKPAWMVPPRAAFHLLVPPPIAVGAMPRSGPLTAKKRSSSGAIPQARHKIRAPSVGRPAPTA